MNFEFSDELKEFRAQLDRALGATAPLRETRRVLDGDAEYSERAWRALAELGVQGATIAPEFGGAGQDALALCVAAEAIGHVLAAVPALSSTYVCSEGLRLHGTPAQRERWLPRLASGELIGTWAVDEHPASASGAPTVEFRDGRLHGRKRPVLDGRIAGVAIVSARDPAGRAVTVVCPLDGPGVSRRALRNVDPSRPVAELHFDGAPAEPLGHDGIDAWRDIVDRAAILLAFEQVGAAERALWMARDYALQRRTFGRPIGSYQAIKHKLANVYAKVELARSHAWYGAWALAREPSAVPLAAAGARCAATEALSFAAQENVQTHGGFGYTWDADCHLYYRRARQQALILGALPEWRVRAFRELERSAAG